VVGFIFSPRWFYGIDIVFEIFIAMITFLIANYGYRYYRISRDKRYKYFSLAFMLIGFSFISKILTNFSIYYEVLKTLDFGFITITTKTIQVSDVLFSMGFFLFRVLLLSAFLLLLFVYEDVRSKKIKTLLIYYLLLTTFFSQYVFFIFHLNAALLLFMLFINAYENYIKKATKSSSIVALCFLTLTISQIVFIFSAINKLAYVIAEALQLFGFSLLLYDYATVSRDEKR